MIKKCAICGESFIAKNGNSRYCSECAVNPAKIACQYKIAEAINRRNAGDVYTVKSQTCEECGKVFRSSYTRAFCSDACTRKNRIRTAVCPQCGDLLISKGNHTGNGYCSAECKEAAVLAKAKAAGNYISCKHCGKEFIRRNESNCFCSWECYRANTVLARQERESKIDRVPVREAFSKICPNCNKHFLAPPNKRNMKYCSPECRVEFGAKKKALDAADAKQKRNTSRSPYTSVLADLRKPAKHAIAISLCTDCKTPQSACERFTSKFVYTPKGAVVKRIDGKTIIVSCPKYT